MDASKGLKDILAASKAGINSLKVVQKKASEDLVALGKQQALFVSDFAQKAAQIGLESLQTDTKEKLERINNALDRAIKAIHGAEERSEGVINSGLAAIREEKALAIAAIRAERAKQ